MAISEPRVEDTVTEPSSPPIEETKQHLRSLNSQVAGLIKQHPATCLLGAVAVGYLLARLARRLTR